MTLQVFALMEFSKISKRRIHFQQERTLYCLCISPEQDGMGVGLGAKANGVERALLASLGGK